MMPPQIEISAWSVFSDNNLFEWQATINVSCVLFYITGKIKFITLEMFLLFLVAKLSYMQIYTDEVL
jgi:hypothetical protein